MSTLLERYVEEPAGQANSLHATDHRPWPMPTQPWRMGQTWRHLLFAHWPIDADLLRPHVPTSLPIDEFDGSAWLGVTPFLIEALRLRGTLPLPLVSTFPELNIRTYVTVDGKPGVCFLRLDTPSRLAIAAASAAFRLPYHHASIDLEIDEQTERVQVHASRSNGDLRIAYEPVGEVYHAEPGSLEYFLTERYRLYTVDERNRPAWADIHHEPWPLQRAATDIERNGYLPAGLDPGDEPIAHLAARQDVVIWPLTLPGRR